MQDENAATAKYYDLAYHFKTRDHLPLELELIKNIVKKDVPILDVGCGTGRHTVPLFENGFEISGIDISSAMLNILKEKNPNVPTIEGDFLNYEFGGKKFGLIICFWNSISEIAKNISELNKFFAQAKKILSPSGSILLNFDDAKTLDAKNFSYRDKFQTDNEEISVSWEVKSLDPKTQITKSKEMFEVKDLDSGEVKTFSTVITQKWWFTPDVTAVAKKYGFFPSEYKLTGVDEIYISFNLVD